MTIALLAVLMSMGASANQPGAASAASSASSQATIKKLRKQVRTLTNSRELWHGRYDIAKDYLDTVTTDLETLQVAHGKTVEDLAAVRAGATTIQGQLTGLQAELVQAQTGVSGLIGTVSAADFIAKVLNPAASRWRAVGGCTSTYTSGDYWSVDFTAGPYC